MDTIQNPRTPSVRQTHQDFAGETSLIPHFVPLQNKEKKTFYFSTPRRRVGEAEV